MSLSSIKRLSSPILTSRRLILRPFTLDDAQALFAWAGDIEVTKYLRFTAHRDISESKKVIQRWIEEAKKPPLFHWAIMLREDNRVIGSISIEILSAHDNRGEVGYCIAKSDWNQGYATEALRTVLEFGLERAGFHRIEACHSVENPGSGKVMKKAGMLLEAGPLRNYYRSDLRGYQDVMMYTAFSRTF
ncbi:MAG: GNAT family N-acetyltransferase [Sphaerochaetaceae bacterium]|jgi:ribosomal-protein-alanine N-acetyltransferase|nr:GNAT family N-acetyltransferase [Sphaerochaetaceae bacterium]MDY0371957.1 GNAT family N-acetyltransferase [Sphaerochaetaceae bacterium]